MIKNTKIPIYPWFTERSVKLHKKTFSVQSYYYYDVIL